MAHLGLPEEEVLVSKRVSLAINILRTRAVKRGVQTHGAKMGIDGDWERGGGWFKKLRTERAVTIFQRPNKIHPQNRCLQTKLCQGGTRTSRLCGMKPWMRPISDNRREVVPRFASLHLLSWNVAQVLAGPPLARCGACSKQAKEFARFFARPGKGIFLVSLMLARIHRVEWRCGHRDC